MNEYTPYYLDFNCFIDETDLNYQLDNLSLEQAIYTAKEIITKSEIKFCTCAILDGWTDNDDNIRGWVSFNKAFDDNPYWKEAE